MCCLYPQVVKLRETLEAEAGIPDLDLVDPALPGFAKRAAEIFHRDGFCIVKVCASALKVLPWWRFCQLTVMHARRC